MLYSVPAAPAFRRADLHDAATIPSSVIAGLWHCDLATEELTWSEGVYALFGMDPTAPIDRRATLACYDSASRIAMECERTTAIRDKSGFTLEARINALDGVERWIRITAQVACEGGKATHLFGSKYDVTDEKRFWDARFPRPNTDVLAERLSGSGSLR